MATKKPTPTAKPVSRAIGPKKPMPKPSSSPTLPTLAEYKESAAYKTGAMSYKQYLDYFKSRGATR